MPKLLEDRRIYDVRGFPPDTYFCYKKSAEGLDRVRLRVTLFKIARPEDLELVHTSWTCSPDDDFEENILNNAFAMFNQPIAKTIRQWQSQRAEEEDESLLDEVMTTREQNAFRALKQIQRQVYGKAHPLRRMLDCYFDTIAVVRGWQPSTCEKYWLALTNQLIPLLPYKGVSQLTARDFDNVIGQLENTFFKANDREYSKSRVDAFFDILFSVMNFIANNLGIENVLRQSRYYDEQRARSQGSWEQQVERVLRVKSLDLSEQCAAAQHVVAPLIQKDLNDQERSDLRRSSISTGLALWNGPRPSESSGFRHESCVPFSTPGYEDRSYLIIQTKVTPNGQYSADLKTVNGYRALPIPKVIDALIAQEREYIKKTYGVSDEDMGSVPLITRNGKTPLKPRAIADLNKKSLQQSLRNPNAKQMITVPMSDGNGQIICLEESATAYQYRRNFCSMWLNILGTPLQEVQAMMGHDIPQMQGRRWMYYHEDQLIQWACQMDQLIFWPIRSEEERTSPWQQADPRETVFCVDHIGEFLDRARLKLQVQPQSARDQVTVHLLVKVREPGDALRFSGASEAEMTILASAFYGSKTAGTRLNNMNQYWDRAFSQERTAEDQEVEEDLECVENVDALEDTDYVERSYEAAESDLSDDEDEWIMRGDEVVEEDMEVDD